MSSPGVLIVGVAGPCVALLALAVGVAVLAIASRGNDERDDTRAPPLGRVFVIGSLVGGLLLAASDILVALLCGEPVLFAAGAGAAAGILSSPLLLASLLAGHASFVALTFPFVANLVALTGTTFLAAQ